MAIRRFDEAAFKAVLKSWLHVSIGTLISRARGLLLRPENEMGSKNKDDLEAAINLDEKLSTRSGGLVVIGLVIELGLALLFPPPGHQSEPGSFHLWIDRWGAVIADSFVALGVIGEIFFARHVRRGEEELRRRSNDAVVAATESAITAQQQSIISLTTAAASNLAAAQATKRAEELRADNLSLQASMRPRRFTFTGWIINPERISSLYEGLKAHAGTVALIQSAPDFETTLFARDIVETLARAGWKSALVTQDQSRISDTSFPEGTWIVPLTEAVDTAAGDLWSALIQVLHEMGMSHDTPTKVAPPTQDAHPLGPVPTFDDITDAIFVRIGLKSSAGFVEMQRRELHRQNEDFDNGLIAHVRAGGKLMASATDGSMVETKIGPNGKLVSADPMKVLSERDDPTLVLGNGIMLRSTPPRNAQ
ncbi:hypothetical protein [Trinickia mobilis]|uniref:hypothetical protein n=1 Tax=Trinickia mobilis TaxID=2816356 RepID=UPI001A8C5871|nr:hypothetical protein [Trinickia mobilis]